MYAMHYNIIYSEDGKNVLHLEFILNILNGGKVFRKNLAPFLFTIFIDVTDFIILTLLTKVIS